MQFTCECGDPLEVVESGMYTCEKCHRRYFLIAAPFEVFNSYDQYLLRRKDPQMEKICSETAMKRLLVYIYNDFMSINITSLTKRGYYDIHTIAPGISDYLKNRYLLYYLAPFHPMAQANIPSLDQLIYLIKEYLTHRFEPLIVSVIPNTNWKALLDSLESSTDFLTKLPHYLHSILIVGINARYDTLYVHDQKAFEPLMDTKFQEIHQRADYRIILKETGAEEFQNANYQKWVPQSCQ
jgi:hypothetical protein